MYIYLLIASFISYCCFTELIALLIRVLIKRDTLWDCEGTGYGDMNEEHWTSKCLATGDMQKLTLLGIIDKGREWCYCAFMLAPDVANRSYSHSI